MKPGNQREVAVRKGGRGEGREGGNQSEAGQPVIGIIIINGFECIMLGRLFYFITESARV